jgi:hypothetical protein
MKAVLIAAALAALLAAAAPVARGANPIQAENALPGSPEWTIGEVRPPAIEGYASEVSVLAGETVHLHVSTSPAERYRVQVYRLGWYGGAGARLVACLPGCGADEAGAAEPVPGPDPATGEVRAGWPVTDTLTVGAEWTTGYYVARLVLTTGRSAGRSQTIFLVVRDPPSRRSAIVVQVPVNTWQAYNNWGGKSLYGLNSTGGIAANRVSFDRPYAPLNQSPFVWEIQLVRFLEREGYDVSYQTDVDTSRDPASLLRHRLAIVAGHDEYWTKEMRDAFDAARDSGTNLAFTGANDGYWQVRYEDGERTLVGYKSQADPIADPALKTVLFRELVPPRFECALEGVQHQGGMRTSRDGPVDYAVDPAALGAPWFAGTGFEATSVLADLVGREWDSIPSYLPEACVHPGLTVYFHHEGPPANADAVGYVAPSGARVFAAGSLQFSWGLDDFGLTSMGHAQPADPRLQQFVRNMLADMTRPAAPLALEARLRRRRRVRVVVRTAPDPRVQAVLVLRHAGPDPFSPADPGVETVCRIVTGTCLDRLPGRGTFRYAAVAVDEWGTSAPVLGPAVTATRRR